VQSKRPYLDSWESWESRLRGLQRQMRRQQLYWSLIAYLLFMQLLAPGELLRWWQAMSLCLNGTEDARAVGTSLPTANIISKSRYAVRHAW
jgi:hypothetical protein